MDIEFILLGSGTSQGVPTIGCDCDTCASGDARDIRLRPSALFRTEDASVVIDTSSDFRQQMLTHRIAKLDAVLFTHHHFDHIGGFDDIRSYNFINGTAMSVYGTQRTLDEIQTTFRYAFSDDIQKGGGVPTVELTAIPEEHASLKIAGLDIETIPAMHGNLPVLGFRIGGIAYLTDTNFVPDSSVERLQGLDYLVLDALRVKPHPTHFCLDESIELAKRIDAKQTYFTHIAHNIKHDRDSALLPERQAFGYDGLRMKAALA